MSFLSQSPREAAALSQELLPLWTRIDEQLCRDRQGDEIPAQGAPLERVRRRLDHGDQVKVTAHSGVTPGIGAEVAETEEPWLAFRLPSGPFRGSLFNLAAVRPFEHGRT